MLMKKEVESFISSFKGVRNKECLENAFINGNCYHFALILKELFNGAIYYDNNIGHFITKIDGKYYDIKGETTPYSTVFEWATMSALEPNLYWRIVNDCVYKKGIDYSYE